MKDTREKEIVDGVYLVINHQIYPIKQSVTKIGRMLDNDLVIQDSLVSRHHAEIHLEGNKYKIVDKNSTGGTYINNKKIKVSSLYSGDVILLANVPIMFINDKHKLDIKGAEETGKLADEPE
jgi:pSer/pThr/pTyr-binding forkhead associated (FHA) protein